MTQSLIIPELWKYKAVACSIKLFVNILLITQGENSLTFPATITMLSYTDHAFLQFASAINEPF